MSTETLSLLLPEIVLVGSATLIYVIGAFIPSRHAWTWLAAAALVVAAVALYRQDVAASPATAPASESEAIAEPGAVLPAEAARTQTSLSINGFSQAVRYGALGVGLLFVLIASHVASKSLPAEFMGSLLLIIAGLMLLSVADDLILVFLALELVSIPTYVILYLGKADHAAVEAAAKYFFLSILSSALMLYGFSFLYGLAGSTRLADLAGATSQGETAIFARLGLVFVVAGLGFRIAAVPFHFYAPDVYQGTSHVNAGLLAVVPKIVGFVALVRIAFIAIPGIERIGWQLSLALALVTMTVGNLLGLWQQNIRRLLAYSSIAHAGYLLIGLAVAFAVAGGAQTSSRVDGIAALLFYLVVYALATAGAFAALAYLSSDRRPIDRVDDLAGLNRNRPVMAAAIALFMFSLTGLPPLAGFWGKLSLFTSALGVDAPQAAELGGLSPWFVGLALAGLLNAAISAAYYLRVVAVMYFRPPLTEIKAEGGRGPALAAALCAVAIVVAGLFPRPLMREARIASQSARPTAVASGAKPSHDVARTSGKLAAVRPSGRPVGGR